MIEYPDSQERSLWEYRKADIDRREGNLEASLEGYKRYLNKWPKGKEAPYALYYASGAYKILHQYNLAIKYAEKLLKDYPDHKLTDPTELIIAESLLDNKQYDGAAKKFKEYIYNHAGSKELDLVYYSLGKCYGDPISASKDELNQALEYYNIVVKDFPDSVWAVSALTKIGMIYSRMKNYEQAIIYFNKYLELQDPRKRSGCDLYFLARFYEKNAEKEKAKNTFNRVIKNFPDSKWAQKAKKVLNEI
jgi:outer membrane protein assembly factor BamD (BamD/ComL family)